MDKRQQQLRREAGDIKETSEKFRERFKRAAEFSSSARSVILGNWASLAEEIRQEQARLNAGRFTDYGPFMVALDADSLAILTLRGLIHACGKTRSHEDDGAAERGEESDEGPGDTDDESAEDDFDEYSDKDELESQELLSKLDPKLVDVAEEIGKRCEHHWRALAGREKDDATAELLTHYARPGLREKRRLEKLFRADWSAENRRKLLGQALIESATKANLVRIGPSCLGSNHVAIDKDFLTNLATARDLLANLSTAILRPMVCPPNPWQDNDSGGYLSNETDKTISLVKHRENRVAQKRLDFAIRSGEMRTVVDAVNALQGTPWRINRRVYQVMKRAVSMKVEENSFPLPHIPEGLRRTGRRWIQFIRRYDTKLKACADLEGEGPFYFPYFLDYRGRAYCHPQYLNFQSDGIGRGLLEFADGKKLGESGVKWLKIHLANCWGGGIDKRSFAGREEWVDADSAGILECVETDESPLKKQWWLGAKKPWRFLAACFEWKECVSRGPDAWSHLPITVDGTCNGFQHLSAICRDAEGARLTNLIDSDRPEDLYEEVAGRLRKKIEKDVARGTASSCLFSSDHFKSSKKLAEKLCEGVDALSVHLWKRIPAPARAVLSDSRTKPTARKVVLIEVLNDILRGPPIREPFPLNPAGAPKAQSTADRDQTAPRPVVSVSVVPQRIIGWCDDARLLVARKPEGVDTILLNRLVLENGYPDEIKRSNAWEAIEVDEMIRERPYTSIDRGTVKKAVMTTPYGITLRGMAEDFEETDFAQLFPARPMEDGSPIPRRRVCAYLAKRTTECIKETMPPAEVLKKWLREIAAALAEQNKPVCWTPPSGFPVILDKCKREKKIIGKGMAAMTVWSVKKPRVFWAAKQKSAVSPNFVHSMDAAHLALTIRRLTVEEKLGHFGVVHDGYAVHACDIDTLNRVLREEFVRIYSGDVLQAFYDEQVAALEKSGKGSDIELPKPPARGEFDITDVLNSKYFFS